MIKIHHSTIIPLTPIAVKKVGPHEKTQVETQVRTQVETQVDD